MTSTATTTGDSVTIPTPLAETLRSYSFAYTAAHDFSVCDRLMIDDYLLIMGSAEVRGREEQYKPATAKQYRQFPGLGFAVHDLVLGPERAALRFTEHGYSLRSERSASWRGISMYRTRGPLLAECRVEQDYFSRQQQLSGAQDTHPVPSPAMDPWMTSPSDPDPTTEERVRNWLGDAGFLQSETLEVDGEAASAPARVQLGDPAATVLDLFTAGDRAVFHVRLDGEYRAGLGVDAALVGRPADLYLTGIVTVSGAGISGHLVTDRLNAGRRLATSHS